MRTGLTFVSALLLACTAAPEAGDVARATAPLEPATRDSAGVTIHEHPGDAIDRAAEITFDSTPLAVIGSQDFENDVTGVFTGVFLPDGRLAGWDGQAGALRIFGADGTQLASFGRRGEGPGEFRGVERVVLLQGDTILVSDWVAQRVTLVHPDGGIGRIETVPTRGTAQAFQVAGVMADGGWLMLPTSTRLLMRNAGPEPDTVRQPLPAGVYRTGSGAAAFDTIVVQHSPRLVRFTNRRGSETETMEGPPRFAAWPIAAPWDGMVVTGSNTDWQFLAYDAEGALRRIIRFNRPLEPVTPEKKDSLVAAQVQSVREMVARDPQMARFENPDDAEFNARNAVWAKSFPPIDGVPPSSGTTLWLLQRRTAREEPTRLLAIAPDGRLLGRLTVPPSERILAVSDDRIAVRSENDDGIGTITVRRIVMP